MSDNTIYAVSSGHPPAGVCIIRVSGPDARVALHQLGSIDSPISRRLLRCRLCVPNDRDALIDDAMVVWFPGPASFTGEDCVEFHVHGGRAVVSAVLAALGGLPGLRLAEPGEFSKRAFENGKLDLSAAEGLADLIAAETEAQRVQALRQLEGGLGDLCLDWQSRLKAALAHMEATIDFSDEDLPDTLDDGARQDLVVVGDEIKASLADGGRGQRIRDGVYVAIVGPPNAGKSSLLNCLAAREVAIVSEHAGTTRDVIEVHLDLGGYAVTVADTAGLRDSEDAIEREGVRRALDRAQQADIRLVVLDGAEWPKTDDMASNLLTESTLGIVNKVDLMEGAPAAFDLDGRSLIGTSVITGEGIECLLAALKKALEERYGRGETAVVTRTRHRDALQACCGHMDRALSVTGAELWAEDLRLAMRELGRVVGQVGVEDVLDVIFSEFCIGK